MPAERIYEQQTTPRPAAAMPLASPDQFGAQIGGALGQAGQQVHQQQVRSFQVNKAVIRNEELAATSHKFALHKQNIDDIVIAGRENPGPGAAGHADRMRQASAAARESLLGGITDPEVRRHAEAQFDDFETRLYDQEVGWEQGQRIAKTVLDKGSERQLASARVFRDPSQLDAEMRAGFEGNAMLHAPPNVVAQLDREWLNELGEAALASKVKTDPPAAKLAMASGEFDYLGGDTIRRYDREADSEIYARAVKLRTEQAAASADFNAQADLAIKQVNAGQPLDDKALEALQSQGAAAGAKPAKLYELSEARVTNQVAREYRLGTPPQAIAGDLAELDARIAKLGDKAPPELVQRRNAVAKVLTIRRGEVANDPLTVGARAGIAVPEIDWDNPDAGTVGQRVASAYPTKELVGGELTMLRQDEVAAFKAELGTGRTGRLKVLAKLDSFDNGFDRAAAARQVAPQDVAFQHLAQLRPEHRGMVVSGQEARSPKANPNLLKPSKDDPRGAAAIMLKVDREGERALKAMPAGDIQAVKDNAKDWYAGLLASRGRASIDEEFDENAYRVAWRVALGGEVQKNLATGGLGNWTGNHPFVIADGFTQAGFAMAVSRDRVAQERAGGGPVDADGKTPFNLNRAYPVMEAPGRYVWEIAPGRTVQDRGGGDFVSTIEAGR